MKNQYARTLMATKAALTYAEKQSVVHTTVVAMTQAYGIALHNEYGFGRDRLQRLEKAVGETIEEWGRMQVDGLDYANAKLQEAYDQAMGKN